MSIERVKGLFKSDLQEKHEMFLHLLELLEEQEEMVIESKGADLVEVVEKILKEGKFPLVDKKLKLIFGVASEHHFMLRGGLYRFHVADEPDAQERSRGGAPDRYIREGMGYYISSMHPDSIVLGENYRPDKQDKDLFMFYRLVRVPEGRPVWTDL